MPHVLISHDASDNAEHHIVRAAIIEVFNASVQETGGSTNTSVPYTDPQPTDAEFIANAVSHQEIYPPETRDVTIVTPRNGNNNCWGADFVQFNWEEQTRTVNLEIPIASLPENYTDADIIAWGKANNFLLS